MAKEPKRTVKSAATQYRNLAEITPQEAAHLDKVWMQIGVATMDVGLDWVNAKQTLKTVKSQLKQKESEIGLDVRDRPEEYGLTKVTEASVQQTVQAHPEIIEMNEEINELEGIVDILMIARGAIADRKDGAANLQQIQLSGLYASATQRATLPTKKK